MSKRNSLNGLFACIPRPASGRLSTSLLLCTMALLPCLPKIALAQAIATAQRGGQIDIFGGFTATKPDYGNEWSKGGFGGADYLLRKFRFGQPGVEVRLSHVGGNTAEGFYGGGIDSHYHIGKFNPYAAVLFGVGTINVPVVGYSDSGNELQLGGGVDYPIRHGFSARAEFMYGFLHISGSKANPDSGLNLTPASVNIGVVYTIR